MPKPDTIPAGWGYAPGCLAVPPTAENLPDLPLLRVLGSQKRARAICQAVAALPFRHQLKARHLQDRYGLNHQTAHDVLRRAQGRAYG